MTTFRFSLDHTLPRQVFSLNGRWAIAGGTDKEPLQHFTSNVPVPSLVDCAEPAYEWKNYKFHWYRTEFTLDGMTDDVCCFLKLNHCMFGTEVWLNGVHLGGSISCYTSQEYPLNSALNRTSTNELLIRVGMKETLPPESAVGRDQEREEYIPGIWGDAAIISTGLARVRLVQVLPQEDLSRAVVNVWIERFASLKSGLTVTARIIEKRSGRVASKEHSSPVAAGDEADRMLTFTIPVEQVHPWTPDDPFLYLAEISVKDKTATVDRSETVFGMRTFSVKGPDFYLNGKKILLRGGNIAFHRFLSDRQRKLLPWDAAWITKVLIDIPKEHHFNFFRNHLGQMYSAWYDIADEHGMLLQNEWQFWCTTGTKKQIMKEFTEWLHDNWNHPSIVIWDPLNEATDEEVQREVVPAMKRLDPSRPWESVDFVEQHPYIYSLGMVLNDRQLGFSRSLEELSHSSVPSMVNEFLWWWLDRDWRPTVLTRRIVERWMGKEYTTDDLIAHQSFLAGELIELFRRLRIRAIQPFVYVSNNDGPTAHWFLDDIKDLRPKPMLKAVRNAFSPLGVSIELWDRHFYSGERREMNVFIFNDTSTLRRAELLFGIRTNEGEWKSKTKMTVDVGPVSDVVLPVTVDFPDRTGAYSVSAEISGGDHTAVSSKIAHVFEAPRPLGTKDPILLLDPSEEIGAYLRSAQFPYTEFHGDIPDGTKAFILHGNVLLSDQYRRVIKQVSERVRTGCRLALIEPEYRIVGSATPEVVDGVSLSIAHRADVESGGYDTYVFAEDRTHPLWKDIDKEHLKFFNGAYGGEIVSQYDVDFTVPSKRLASCGEGCAVTAAAEIEYGRGKILLFRLQLRGRLIPSSDRSLYARRPDPVAQRLLWNLIEYCGKV